MRPWLGLKVKTLYGSQANFARSCKKSDNWVSRIVTGRDDPSQEDQDMILEKLGVADDDQRELLFTNYRPI